MKLRKKGVEKNESIDPCEYDFTDLKFNIKVLEDDINVNHKSKNLCGCIKEIAKKFMLVNSYNKITLHIIVSTIDDTYLADTKCQMVKSNTKSDSINKISSEIYSELSKEIPCLKI